MTTKKLTAVIGIPVITIAAIFGGVAARNQYVNHDWKTFRQTEEVKLKLLNDYGAKVEDLENQINEQTEQIKTLKAKAVKATTNLNNFNKEHSVNVNEFPEHNALLEEVNKAQKELVAANVKLEDLTKEKEKNERYKKSYEKVEETSNGDERNN